MRFFLAIYWIETKNMVYNRCEKKSQGGSAMIYEFNFKNFRSYKSSAGIDFTAKPIGEFKE